MNKVITSNNKNTTKIWPKKDSGFSLTEALIVITIIAIIAAISIALYSNYITKSKLSEIDYLDSVDSRNISIYLSSNGGTFGTSDEFNDSSLKSQIESNNGSDCIVSKTVTYINSDTIDIDTNVNTSLC